VLEIGISPFASTRAGMLAVAAAAVDGGIHRLWLGDGLLVNPDFPGWAGSMEPFTTLAWLAGRHPQVAMGVSAAVLPIRDVVWTMKQAATLDHVTGGRTVLVVAPGFWARELEYRGVDPDQRGARFRSDLAGLRALLAGEEEPRVAPVPFSPDSPPVWLAGERATRALAWRLGLPFQASRIVPADLAPLAREWFDEGGRQLAVRIRVSVTPEPPQGVDVEWNALAGPPAYLAEQLAEYAALGVTDVSLIPGQDDTGSLATTEAIVSEVLPHLAGIVAPPP
jgi:alkanesulfonate monooxygenase SsuD/methylene tetrahydromethanopterin reductase-like flavin-dependent oxidoreductase (luciferase family)